MKMNKQKWKQLLVGEFSVWRLVRLLVIVYLTISVFVFFASDRMLFPVRPSSYVDSPDIVKIPRGDGTFLSAVYLLQTNAACTVLYSHGNAEDIGELLPYFRQYAEQGFSVLAYDYQGYGTSEGKPTEAGTCKDIEAAYRYLVQTRGVPTDRILAHGRSVGSGPATYLASRHPLGGLILESAFVSAFRVVVPTRILPFDRFPNLRRIRHVTCPVLVLHGTADETIPIWHGQALFAAANEPKQYLWIEDAGHDDLSWNREAYWNGICAFRDSLPRK